jgi:hypothetical protein
VIEQLFGKAAAVVIAGAEEEDTIHRSNLFDPLASASTGDGAILMTIGARNVLQTVKIIHF